MKHQLTTCCYFKKKCLQTVIIHRGLCTDTLQMNLVGGPVFGLSTTQMHDSHDD